VDDLFNPSSVESDNAVQTKEDDTIKFVAKRKRAKNAALPPKSRYDLLTFVGGTISDGYLDFSASMLACAHGFPFSSSPEHTGTTYGHLHAADYEIGFRYRTRSPRSQVFVVRHNPSSPPNALRVDEPNSNSKRLLPFPPVTGETHLHHPKRRTLVGNIDNPSVTYSGSLDVRVKGHETLATDSTTSGTEGYETALETQNESEGGAPTINGGHEELTVAGISADRIILPYKTKSRRIIFTYRL